MARRPLFCPTCTELLDQLEKAADAVCHGESAFRQVRERALEGDSRTAVDLSTQYLKIKERAQDHLERHIRGTPVSAESASSQVLRLG